MTHSINDTVDFEELASLRLLADTDIANVARLLHRCPLRILHQDEQLLSPTHADPALHLVLRGRLRMHLDSPWTEPVQFIEPGEITGEMSLILGKPAHVYVAADIPTNVLIVGQEAFWSLVQAEPAVARNILGIIVERMRMNGALADDSMQLRARHRRQTRVDDLTQLLNRYAFQDLLRRQALRSSMNMQPLTLLVLDIGDFQRFRKTAGRETGDHTLYLIAQTIRNHLRPTDIAARVGAHRFAIMLIECNDSDGRAVAGRLQAEIAEAVAMQDRARPLPPLTLASGIAQLRPFEDIEQLLERAEHAVARERRRPRADTKTG
jgi:diguanylate cyclase